MKKLCMERRLTSASLTRYLMPQSGMHEAALRRLGKLTRTSHV